MSELVTQKIRKLGIAILDSSHVPEKQRKRREKESESKRGGSRKRRRKMNRVTKARRFSCGFLEPIVRTATFISDP